MAFELAAGFLRIDNADNPLDASAVHPESYHIVNLMAKDKDCRVADLMRRDDLRSRINLENYVGKEYGLPTLGTSCLSWLSRDVILANSLRRLLSLRTSRRLTSSHRE